jgi:hypothetical protein
MAQISIRRVDRRNPSSTWLGNYRHNVFSQIGQDGVLAKTFEVIGLGQGSTSLEFGAWDGMYLSNTANLVKNLGWRGIFIEGNADKYHELRLNYESEILDNRVVAINDYVQTKPGQGSLKEIINRHSILTVNFLSIDIDGNDIHILRSLSFRPECILIEFNPSISNDCYFAQEDDFSLNQGASLLAILSDARELGYELIYAFDFDALLVRRDKYHLFGIEDNSIDAMHMPLWDSRFIQCYDGTIYIDGFRRLIWHGIDFGSDELQLLPKQMRRFTDAQF